MVNARWTARAKNDCPSRAPADRAGRRKTLKNPACSSFGQMPKGPQGGFFGRRFCGGGRPRHVGRTQGRSGQRPAPRGAAGARSGWTASRSGGAGGPGRGKTSPDGGGMSRNYAYFRGWRDGAWASDQFFTPSKMKYRMVASWYNPIAIL